MAGLGGDRTKTRTPIKTLTRTVPRPHHVQPPAVARHRGVIGA
jgi:hypothetical protein